jgi:hypothetical protein
VRDLSSDETDATTELLSAVYRRTRGGLRTVAEQAMTVLASGTWRADDNDLLRVDLIADLGMEYMRPSPAEQQAGITSACERLAAWRSEVVAEVKANGVILTAEERVLLEAAAYAVIASRRRRDVRWGRSALGTLADPGHALGRNEAWILAAVARKAGPLAPGIDWKLGPERRGYLLGLECRLGAAL